MEKLIARFMAITILILIAIAFLKENLNRVELIGDTSSASPSKMTAMVADNETQVAPLKEDIRVLGYSAVDYEGDDRSYQSVRKYHEYLDAVSTFSYLVDRQGNLTGTPPVEELELHRQKGIISLALIHNYTNNMFDSELAASVLGNPEKRKNLVDNIIKELTRNSYSGVNVDIENIPYSQRDNYVKLLAELKDELENLERDEKYYLIASVPAKTDDDINHSWSAGFDYKAIGQYTDKVQLMTYDEHWFGGEPGPIASIGWVEDVIKYAVSAIEPEKILLGIPSYGYRWASDGSCEPVTPEEVYNIVENNKGEVLWHEDNKAPYYIFTNAKDITFTTWFENTESISYKLDLVNKYNLGGIALWRLGFEEPEMWKAVEQKLSYNKTTDQ